MALLTSSRVKKGALSYRGILVFQGREKLSSFPQYFEYRFTLKYSLNLYSNQLSVGATFSAWLKKQKGGAPCEDVGGVQDF